MMSAIKTQSVPSLERALAILEVLADSKVGLSLSELARKAKIPKSSTHCLVLTLQRHGYLFREDTTGRLTFGLQLFRLADKGIQGLKLCDQAAPRLRELMKRTQLTVHMGILENYEVVLAFKCDVPGKTRVASWIGKRMCLHSTGLGKALMAYLPGQEVERIIEEYGLPRHNENTLCSRKRLKEDLVRTVQRGYALDDEEDELGSRCIGAPVFGFDSRLVASISVAGTTDEITFKKLRELAEQVKHTAMEISAAIGHDRAVGSLGVPSR
jgi:DNA-binding IclR family transcriptional regulator